MLQVERWKIILVGVLIALSALVIVPNFFPRETVASWPAFMPKRQVVLGLDLRGGAHLLLQVERASIVEDRVEALLGDIRQTLRDQRIGYQNLRAQGQAITFTLRDPADAEKARAALQPLTAPVQSGVFGASTVSEVTLENTNTGAQFRATLTDEGIDERLRTAVDQSIAVLERRLNELGTVEPSIQRQGEDRILVQVPGLEDTAALKDILGRTARMTFHLECPEGSLTEALQGRAPAGCEVANSAEEGEPPILIESRAALSGDDLTDAQPAYDQQTSQPIVTFRFNSRGGAVFGRLTQENVGRRFAVVLDGEAITAPVIRTPILGGSGQIEGNFTVETANRLAVLLRAGALPADLTIIEERTVGPSLGQDSIRAGIVASLVGLALVCVLMVSVYGLLGMIAVTALLVNLLLLFAALTLLQATLTLPGIAGIILTIGVAVDSNVIIYERIREEARVGRSAIGAIDTGFTRALGTIIDANFTALIATIALFTLGSGPIRGFAVTTGVGIVTTVVTAFTLTRIIVAVWVRLARPKAVAF